MDQQTFLTAIEFTGVASGGDSIPPVVGLAPTSLTAITDTDSIELEWTNTDTYTAVVIERKTTGDYTALTTEAGDAESYDDTTAVPGTEYTYKVRGVKSGYPTPFSNEASDTIPLTEFRAVGFDGVETSYLSTTNITAVQFASTDKYIIGGWIKPTAINVEYHFLELSDADTGIVTDLWISGVGNFMGTVFEETKVGPALSAGTKQFFLFYYDPAEDTFSISKDGGTDATSGVVIPPELVTTLTIGASLANETGFLGVLDEVFICKNPSDLAAAVTFAKETIYNSGIGTHYSTLSAGNKTTLGLVAWWQFDEASGIREDSEGSTDLTATGGVTAATALID